MGGEYYKDKTPATVYDENNIDGFVTMDQLNQIREQYKKLTGYDTAGFGQHTPEIWSANVMARLDWNINDNNKMMLRYNYGGASATSTTLRRARTISTMPAIISVTRPILW